MKPEVSAARVTPSQHGASRPILWMPEYNFLFNVYIYRALLFFNTILPVSSCSGLTSRPTLALVRQVCGVDRFTGKNQMFAYMRIVEQQYIYIYIYMN
jgi:hypothetical protein